MLAMPSLTELKEIQRRIALYDDEKAYKELFFFFYKSLTQFAFSFVKSREMSEEVISDVFINIWKGRKRSIKVFLKKRGSEKILLKPNEKIVAMNDAAVKDSLKVVLKRLPGIRSSRSRN
jgi:RNA polymerase sigma-70 factor (ECF subfamily)